MKHTELLAAIADLEPVSLNGTFQRHTSLRWNETRASASGGRWGAPGAFEVLYLGRPPDSVVIEAYRHLVDDDLDSPSDLAASVLERRVLTCEVEVDEVLDLRGPDARHAVALSDAQLHSEVGDYGPCQAIGAAAHQLGLTGVLAPAATRFGETLALFPLNLPIEQWPRVVARDIWRGLPADPRRLRLVDGSAEPGA